MVGSEEDECHSVTEFVEAHTIREAIAVALSAHPKSKEEAVLNAELVADRVLRVARLKGN